ncbi:hypothetical protein NDU88_009955 [Pleurodeles waltl]|uniref:Uncharacterized protein n=1 Tax=Pleurodeles waltl TaxID=8319 RepID=A0AAV7S0H2_PLEWA|nr:hypothetical protein NDU88_009955 [Pleurodeles waltl]
MCRMRFHGDVAPGIRQSWEAPESTAGLSEAPRASIEERHVFFSVRAPVRSSARKALPTPGRNPEVKAMLLHAV